MDRQEIGAEYFLSGYNCAQSVVLSFQDILDVDEETLLKISAPFGGGLSRMREVCGAVSGMAMIMGLLYCSLKVNEEKKAEIYSRTQEVVRIFEQEQGSIVCRELLERKVQHEDPIPESRTAQYYKERPCMSFVCAAISYVEDYIKEHPYGEL